MLQIAYFSPLPPQRTGVSDYSAELLPHIAKEVEITLFATEPDKVPDSLQQDFAIRHVGDFPGMRWNYDLALYQIGNSPYHKEIYYTLRRYPGLVALHDYSLHHFIAGLTIGNDDFAGYVRELAYAKGYQGVELAHAIHWWDTPAPLFEWPLSDRLVDLSLGVIVHSDHTRLRLLQAHPQAYVQRINLPIQLPTLRDRSAVRAKLGLPLEGFIVATIGLVTPEKRLDLVLEAFAQFHRQHPNSLWLVIGDSATDEDPWKESVWRMGLGEAVHRLGYVESLDAFNDYIAACDACINLRFPTAGETSSSILRAMAMGQPVIASDAGWYSELPDECCAKVEHDGSEVDQLCEILHLWSSQEEMRLSVSKQARAYVERECDPEAIGQHYVSIIKQTLGLGAKALQ